MGRDGMGMVHRVGKIALIRACIIRTLMASAVLAGALTLAGCYGDEGYQLPTRAMKELSPEMLTLLEQKNMPKDSPILVRIFKEESELEVWKQDTTGHYELLKVYPICRWSGDLGPKVKEGDRQAPEGFYPITPGLMNPNSSYYLAINTGFPNAFDRANNYHGAFLMIHGDCSSRGCYAMTDEQIGEIYSLARESFLGGEKEFQVQAYPFRLTPANLARHRNNPNLAFWKMLKVGNDHFMVSHLEPKVDVCEKRYVFDAQPPANSTTPLNFSPTGRCPAFQVNPEIAGPADAKQRNDEYQLAQLISRDVPTAPLVTNTDGGMNRAFIAKLDNPTYTYDNEGHIHVPPLQAGRLPPEISGPRSSEAEDATGQTASNSGSVGKLFNGLFAEKASPAPPVSTASSDAGSQMQGNMFSRLFTSKHDDKADATREAEQPTGSTTSAAKPKRLPASEPVLAAGLRPRLSTEPAKNEKTAPQQAAAAKSGSPGSPQKEANAAAPASAAGLINGSQPVLPSGSFDSRWGGLQ
jgi:murein L,D-transpeptidase YafK